MRKSPFEQRPAHEEEIISDIGQRLSAETQPEDQEDAWIPEQALAEEGEVLQKLEQLRGDKMKRVIASFVLVSALVFGAGAAEAQSFPNAKKTTVEDQLRWQAEQKAKGSPGWQESGPITIPVQKDIGHQRSEKYKQTVENFWRDVGLISGPLGADRKPSETDKRMADQSLKEAAAIILGTTPDDVTPKDKVHVFDAYLSNAMPQFQNQDEFRQFRNRGGVSAIREIILMYRSGSTSR